MTAVSSISSVLHADPALPAPGASEAATRPRRFTTGCVRRVPNLVLLLVLMLAPLPCFAASLS